MRHAHTVAVAVCLTALVMPATAEAAVTASTSCRHQARLLAAGLSGSSGSTVGPDGALYVAEGGAGRISRVDRKTGRTSVFATGLPARAIPGLGGVIDVAFIGGTAYALVTLVSPDVGGTAVDGIYRVDGAGSFTVVADLGQWSLAHPPATAYFVPTGLQFALQAYHGGFLVTDGHHNRVLQVTLAGGISQVATLDNVVPTGLDVRGRSVVLAEAGPVPHLPQDGAIVSLTTRTGAVRPVASGAPLLVDVEFGPDGHLFALSQGHFTPGGDPGSPADPGTGSLERVTAGGGMAAITTGLNQPTSLEIVGSTAYVITLDGKVWRIDDIA